MSFSTATLLGATNASIAHDEALQREIWQRAVAATTRPGMPNPPAMLLLPALNEMIDITTTRVMATTYVIIDLEFPRPGLVRVDSADQVLMELRASMR